MGVSRRKSKERGKKTKEVYVRRFDGEGGWWVRGDVTRIYTGVSNDAASLLGLSESARRMAGVK